jgi:putative nucleotidyltransferase with HDIG domain
LVAAVPPSREESRWTVDGCIVSAGRGRGAAPGIKSVRVLETVQRDALDSGADGPRVVDPAVRERTLAGLRGLQQIPALQSLANGFLHTLGRPEVSVPEVVEAIRKDSALCVRLLRASNSVLVSPERRIEDLDTAVHMLGVLRVRQMMQAMFTLRDGHRVATGFDWRHLWIHALATAAIAEELEKRLRSADNSQIHLAALLHDVGKIVLSTLAPDDYRSVLMRAWHDGGTLDELERGALGVDHREAGVAFAQHNRLPEVVVQAIAHHHCPPEATSYRLEVAVISLANYLSKAHGLGFSGARLREADGEFSELPAWAVVEEMCGGRLDAAAIEADMADFLAELRAELRGMREGV